MPPGAIGLTPPAPVIIEPCTALPAPAETEGIWLSKLGSLPDGTIAVGLVAGVVPCHPPAPIPPGGPPALAYEDWSTGLIMFLFFLKPMIYYFIN
jgi:hypothetical protein